MIDWFIDRMILGESFDVSKDFFVNESSFEENILLDETEENDELI